MPHHGFSGAVLGTHPAKSCAAIPVVAFVLVPFGDHGTERRLKVHDSGFEFQGIRGFLRGLLFRFAFEDARHCVKVKG